jgi:outer membrane lipoprotein-sorting protein
MQHRPGARQARRHAAVALCTAAALLAGLHASAGQRPSSAAGAAARPSFDELYRRGQQANAGIKTLTARFTETTTAALLERPLVARGTLYVQRTKPARVAMHYSDPAGRTILIDGNRMVTSWPSRQLHASSDIGRAQREIEKYFGAADARELRRLFDIELRDASSRPGTHEVSMTPKQKRISETLTRLELWVNDPSGLLNAMRMTFANGDTKLMEFEDVAANPAIDPAVFSAPK